ncbi:SAM-dependent methyltransferase [Streptosporangium sp. H16]|uniref:SAM-dependent methyltransferase n=1 Tax=Streptosporangium sp. H16 TaxID=3444184 RepID=UPI003F7A895E
MPSQPDAESTTGRPYDNNRAVNTLCFSRPSAPRIDNYLLTGKAIYELDQEAGDSLIAAVPGIRDTVRARRAFVKRTVRRFAENGIDQFVDFGCGMPSSENVHQVAHAVNSNSRVIYIDHDPIVLQHAWAHLSYPGTEVVTADVRDMRLVLAALHEHGLLNLCRPAGVLLTGVLDFVADTHLSAIFTGLRKSLAPGSRVALTHICTNKLVSTEIEAITSIHTQTQTPIYLRDRNTIGSLLQEFDLDGPGLVGLYPWGPEEGVWPVKNSFLLGATGTLNHVI